jgi:hypothetical protein
MLHFERLCSYFGLTTVFDKVLARLKLPKENLRSKTENAAGSLPVSKISLAWRGSG